MALVRNLTLATAVLALAAGLAPTATLGAQQPGTGKEIALPAPAPRPAAAEFRARRDALRSAIGDGIAVMFGSKKPVDMGGMWQTQDFAYLGGVDEPNHAMILAGGQTVVDELLVPPFSRFAAQWEGEYLAPGDDAATTTGFAAVTNLRGLTSRLQELLPDGGKGKKIWLLLSPAVPVGGTPGQSAGSAAERKQDAFDGRSSAEAAARAKLTELFPEAKFEDLTPVLHRLRTTKSPIERALLAYSAEVAAEGIAEAMRCSRPGLYEFQLAAVARYVFSLRGAGPDAYGAIVGSGKNGCVLHYMSNKKQIEDGDLIVMDYAPTVQGYASDVTRTFPANGKFTPEQRQLVQDVHAVQQELIAMVKPGAKLSVLGRKCSDLLAARGYRSDHGPCHHVGLAVHDPSVDELAEGMVITVEPGAYLRDKAMGCRIEDTILVTATGCEVLSKGVPSTPDEIEALMKQDGITSVPVGLPAGR